MSRAKRQHIMPAKSTKRRAILLLMMRPQGITATEAAALGLVTSTRGMTSTVARFRDELDMDIMTWRRPPSGKQGAHSTVAHRIAGRWRNDGKYLDYLARTIRSEKQK